jgi:hypothetical protein
MNRRPCNMVLIIRLWLWDEDGETRNAYIILLGKRLERHPTGRPKMKRQNIDMGRECNGLRIVFNGGI